MPGSEIVIMPFDPAYAPELSALIVRNLREVNAADYPEEVIRLLCERYSPEGIARIASERYFVMALAGPAAVGTASLDPAPTGWPAGCGLASAVFVLPEYHGCSVGRRLMEHLERYTARAGLSSVVLEASVTAHGFYRKIGYADLPDGLCDAGAGKCFRMEKNLS